MTQPTHDEVIAWIDKEIAIQRQYLDSSFYLDKKPHEIQLSVWLAIRDVLERHKVDEENYLRRYAGNDNQVRYEMCMCEEDFPCPTYTDIYNRISEVM